MTRSFDIMEWTATRKGKAFHISATLMGNVVRVFECEESAIAGWCGSIEMPADVLLEIADAFRTADRRVSDARQLDMLDRSEY